MNMAGQNPKGIEWQKNKKSIEYKITTKGKNGEKGLLGIKETQANKNREINIKYNPKNWSFP